jgi:hypothetical protein
MRRSWIRGAIVTCIAAATLSNAGAAGLESGGVATIESLRYDRVAAGAGMAVNWTVPVNVDPNVSFERVQFREALGLLEGLPVIGNTRSGGGVYSGHFDGHGVTGTLGRSDHGTVDRTILTYTRLCSQGCLVAAQFWCEGTYTRRELVFTMTLGCTPARFYVGTPPLQNPYLEATWVLVPVGAQLKPKPGVTTYNGYGVFTAS